MDIYEALFNPESVVIIGASNSPFNLGATICNFLMYMKYSGKIFAVNRKGEDVHGCKGYTAVTDIDADIDCAVIITPAGVVNTFARQCGEKGIKALIIESAGFSEEGPEGEKLQVELDAICERHGMRYLGPNCLGVLNTHNKFCCFYGIVPGKYDETFNRPGNVSYIIQSGGIGALIMDSLKSDVSECNKMISIGNKADLDETDIIQHLAGDNTEVIGMYLENVRDGKRLIQAVQSTDKPVIAYKVGRTSEGARAAMSHTAGMASNDKIFDCACRQAGIIRANTISELHTLPKIFTHMPLLRGKKIAVITNSGAFGGITADLLVDAGLEMAVLKDETVQKLNTTGKLYNAANPVDLGPALSIQTFRDIFEILLTAEEVDGLLPVPNVWQDVVIDAIIELIEMCNRFKKPAAIYIPNAVERILDIRKTHQIPVFESPEDAVTALAASNRHHRKINIKEQAAPAGKAEDKYSDASLQKVKEIIGEAKKGGRKNLSEHESKNVLKALGIPVTEETAVKGIEEACRAAESLGFPVAIKGHSPSLTHKTEMGAVMLNIQNSEEAKNACEKIYASSKTDEFLVQRMIIGKREFVAGTLSDNVFGPCVMFGLGGIFTEALEDITFRVAPFRKEEALEMLNELKSSKLLGPFRGDPEVNSGALGDLLCALGDSMLLFPEIREIDVNPILIEDKNPVAVDALVVLS